VPGAAGVLLEALRWRGRTAKTDRPTLATVVRRLHELRVAQGRPAKATLSRSARSFLDYGKKTSTAPRVGAIAILFRKGRQ